MLPRSQAPLLTELERRRPTIHLLRYSLITSSVERVLIQASSHAQGCIPKSNSLHAGCRLQSLECMQTVDNISLAWDMQTISTDFLSLCPSSSSAATAAVQRSFWRGDRCHMHGSAGLSPQKDDGRYNREGESSHCDLIQCPNFAITTYQHHTLCML